MSIEEEVSNQFTNVPRTALITGCSAGEFGSALVEEFHAKGLHVFATARSRSKIPYLEPLPSVKILELDVTSQPSITAALENRQSVVLPALDTSDETAKRLFEVHFFGVLSVNQAFRPLVIAARQTIMNVCSISGVLNAPWQGIYNTSKAALMSWSETPRLQPQPFCVSVVSLVTGSVYTNITSQDNIILREDSFYHKATDAIRKRGRGEDRPANSTPAEFAGQVAGDVFGGAEGIMSSFAPGLVLDRMLKDGTGLDQLP
ncbi:hypothetical protein BDV12DRAFT_211266 [Aspergillus spectabilis]